MQRYERENQAKWADYAYAQDSIQKALRALAPWGKCMSDTIIQLKDAAADIAEAIYEIDNWGAVQEGKMADMAYEMAVESQMLDASALPVEV